MKTPPRRRLKSGPSTSTRRIGAEGVGGSLWHQAEVHLDAAGFSDITLWVLKENAQAIAFYESIGLVVEPGSEKAILIGGAELLEIRLRKRLGH